MATRVPLTINTGSSTIEELPSGDDLNLTGSNISNVSNINSVGTVTANSLSITGNITTANINGGNLVTANFISGTLTTTSQPNITSIGALGSLNVTGNAGFGGVSNLGPIGNVKISGGSANQFIQTDGNGNLSYSTVSAASYMLQPVRVAATENITLSGTPTIDGVVVQVGDRVLVYRQTNQTENGIYVVASGSWTRASDFTTGSQTLSGGVTVTPSSGTNLAGVTFVCTNTTAITIGSTNITWARSSNTGIISIWTAGSAAFEARATGATNSGATAIGVGASAAIDSVAIGYAAVTSTQGVVLGYQATSTVGNATAIGTQATVTGQNGTALGRNAVAGSGGVSVGYLAGFNLAQGVNHVAVGRNAGFATQGANTVAIGAYAGHSTQGTGAVAIGANAGYNTQANNSIVINATGANLENTTANSIVVKPVRAVTSITGLKQLYYDPTSGEIVYYNI